MTDADDALLARLARMAPQLDPIPEPVMRGARGAFSFRTIAHDLAKLVFDSARGPLAGVRGGGVRQLTFEAPGLIIEIELDSTRQELIGQVAPADGVAVHLLSDDDSLRECQCDDLGRFHASELAPGRLSLRVLSPMGEGRKAIDTPWLTV